MSATVFVMFSPGQSSWSRSTQLLYKWGCLSCHSIYRSVHWSVYLSFCLSIFLSLCLFVYLSICLSICLFMYVFVCLSIYIRGGRKKSILRCIAILSSTILNRFWAWFVSPHIPVCVLETRRASLHRICAVRHVRIAWQCVLLPAVFYLDML